MTALINAHDLNTVVFGLLFSGERPPRARLRLDHQQGLSLVAVHKAFGYAADQKALHR